MREGRSSSCVSRNSKLIETKRAWSAVEKFEFPGGADDESPRNGPASRARHKAGRPGASRLIKAWEDVPGLIYFRFVAPGDLSTAQKEIDLTECGTVPNRDETRDGRDS